MTPKLLICLLPNAGMFKGCKLCCVMYYHTISCPGISGPILAPRRLICLLSQPFLPHHFIHCSPSLHPVSSPCFKAVAELKDTVTPESTPGTVVQPVVKANLPEARPPSSSALKKKRPASLQAACNHAKNDCRGGLENLLSQPVLAQSLRAKLPTSPVHPCSHPQE